MKACSMGLGYIDLLTAIIATKHGIGKKNSSTLLHEVDNSEIDYLITCFNVVVCI